MSGTDYGPESKGETSAFLGRGVASLNQPAAGNAGIASRLTIGHHWPGVPEPERWAVYIWAVYIWR